MKIRKWGTWMESGVERVETERMGGEDRKGGFSAGDDYGKVWGWLTKWWNGSWARRPVVRKSS